MSVRRLRRAVDHNGKILDYVVQRRRDTEAALKLLRLQLRNQPVEPERIVADVLGSCAAALDRLGLGHLHLPGRLQENNGAKTPTCRSDDASVSSNCSRAEPQPNAFSPPTPSSTTPSTCGLIWSADRPCVSFGLGLGLGLIRPSRRQPSRRDRQPKTGLSRPRTVKLTTPTTPIRQCRSNICPVLTAWRFSI